jgi:hypothetical protein
VTVLGVVSFVLARLVAIIEHLAVGDVEQAAQIASDLELDLRLVAESER